MGIAKGSCKACGNVVYESGQGTFESRVLSEYLWKCVGVAKGTAEASGSKLSFRVRRWEWSEVLQE